MKLPVIRKGDYIKVINPRPIIRVGYKVHPSHFYDEIEKDEKIMEALESIGVWCGGKKFTDFLLDNERKVPRGIVHALAYERVGREGFGGNERSIHYHEGNFDHLKGKIFYVHDKIIRKTGKRFPSSGGYSWDGEYDYEPGGLENEKTHILFKVYHDVLEPNRPVGALDLVSCAESYFERCDVELSSSDEYSRQLYPHLFTR